MKKLLGILVLGLLWSNTSFAETSSPNKLHYKCYSNDQTLVRDIEVAKLFDKFFGWDNRYPGTVKDRGSKFELYVKQHYLGDSKFVEFFYDIEKYLPVVKLKMLDDSGKLLGNEATVLNCKVINNSFAKS